MLVSRFKRPRLSASCPRCKRVSSTRKKGDDRKTDLRQRGRLGPLAGNPKRSRPNCHSSDEPTNRGVGTLGVVGPLTTSLQGLWVSGLLPPDNGGPYQTAATPEPTRRQMGLTQNSRAGIPKRKRPNCQVKRYSRTSVGSAQKGGDQKTPVCSQEPWLRGATCCCRLSRQLLARSGRARPEHLLRPLVIVWISSCLAEADIPSHRITGFLKLAMAFQSVRRGLGGLSGLGWHESPQHHASDVLFVATYGQGVIKQSLGLQVRRLPIA